MNLENIKLTTGCFDVRNLRMNVDIIRGEVYDMQWKKATWCLDGSYYHSTDPHKYDLDPSNATDLSNTTTPTHYPNAGKDDVIAFCVKNNLGFIEGNIIKYVTRYKAKNGIEDLHKAKKYLNRLIESNAK